MTVIWWRLADDRPSQAKWLNDQEKQDLESALAAEQVGIKAVKNYTEAFRSPKVIILALQFFCWSIGVYGYLNSSTGSPGASYLLMSGALMLSVVLTIFLKPGASDRERPTVDLTCAAAHS